MVEWKWQRGAAVTEKMALAFFSYSRNDSDFVLKLCQDLKANDALVWLDQLDIDPGRRWDEAIQEALSECLRLLVVLSPASVESTHVMDEVSYALEKKKLVIPVLYRDCTIPFRLRRVKYIDFRSNYQSGLSHLLMVLRGGAAAERHTSSSRTKANLPSGRFRSSPASLSQDQAKIIIARHGFYSSDWNPAGKGIEHEYNPQIIGEALVVVDHGTELMWEKGVAAFAKYFSNPTPEARLEELNTKFAGFDNWRLPTLEEAMSLVTTHEEALATKRSGKEAIHLHPIFERTGTHRIWTSDSGIWTIIVGEGMREELDVLWVVDFLEGRCALSPSFHQGGFDVKAVRSMSGGS
jgi:hypothetical protein